MSFKPVSLCIYGFLLDCCDQVQLLVKLAFPIALSTQYGVFAPLFFQSPIADSVVSVPYQWLPHHSGAYLSSRVSY